MILVSRIRDLKIFFPLIFDRNCFFSLIPTSNVAISANGSLIDPPSYMDDAHQIRVRALTC